MNKHGGYWGKTKEMVDFSVNINPLGIPKGLKKKLTEGISDLVRYPEISGESAQLKLAKDLDKEKDQLILGNGAIELIYLFARSLKPGKALIIQPTFNEYERALKMYGWEINHLILKRENDFLLQTKKFESRLEIFKPDLIFMCNPNNPTGKLYSSDQIKRWMECSSPQTTWFFDESFIDFTESAGMLKEDLNEKKIFILKSLTKFYALPGLRIGYGAGNPQIIKKMITYKEPWTINSLALIALNEVYQEKVFAKETRVFIKAQREMVYRQLETIPYLQVFKSDTDFHLCRLTDNRLALVLKEALEKKGMSLRTCEDFLGLDASYFRIALKKAADNAKLIDFLKNWKE